MRQALRTRLCELAGVEYPIVQTGMGWVSGPELTAATANAGGSITPTVQPQPTDTIS